MDHQAHLHGHIYNFFSNLGKKFDTRDYVWDYRNGLPVPFIVFDNFLPREIFHGIKTSAQDIPQDQWTEFTRNGSYMMECKNFESSPLLTTLTHCFNSGDFIDWLEDLTGHRKIISDPHLIGAGISKTPPGEGLKLHTDFNWNDELALNRCLSMILYINDEWSDDWGGALEFWDFERENVVQSIACRANRLLIWDYDERLYHGYPQALACPEDNWRQAFRLFFYQSDGRPRTTPHRSLYWYDEENRKPFDRRDQA